MTDSQLSRISSPEEYVGRPSIQSDGSAVTSRRRRLVVLLALVGLSLALHVPGMVRTLFNSDEASIATMADVIDHGGTLYKDTADRKPPLVPYLVAGVFRVTGSRDLRPVRALGAVILALTAAMLGREATRRYQNPRAGLWCGVLFLLGEAAFFPNDAQAISFELFMLLPMTASVIAAGRGRPLSAGAWLAVACLTKQTAVITAIPVAYLLVRSVGLRRTLHGAAVGLAIIGAVALAFDPARFFLWTVTGNAGYLAVQGPLLDALLRGLAVTAALAGMNLAVVFLVVRAGRRLRRDLDLWLWLGSGVVAVAAGMRFFGHYYLQILPPLVLIAAGTVPAVAYSARRLVLVGSSLTAATAMAIGFVPTGDITEFPSVTVAERVKAATDSHDSVFIWGDFPEVYYLSGRLPATRFIHTGFLTGNTGGRPNGSGISNDGVPGAWAMLQRDMTRLPDLIVDTSSAGIRQSELYPIYDTPLWPMVSADYRLLEMVDGVRLYQLRSG